MFSCPPCLDRSSLQRCSRSQLCLCCSVGSLLPVGASGSVTSCCFPMETPTWISLLSPKNAHRCCQELKCVLEFWLKFASGFNPITRKVLSDRPAGWAYKPHVLTQRWNFSFCVFLNRTGLTGYTPMCLCTGPSWNHSPHSKVCAMIYSKLNPLVMYNTYGVRITPLTIA